MFVLVSLNTECMRERGKQRAKASKSRSGCLPKAELPKFLKGDEALRSNKSQRLTSDKRASDARCR